MIPASIAVRACHGGNALAPTGFQPSVGDRWAAEFPASKALSACGVAISRDTTPIRAVDCATTTGSALASWNGSGQPITGTVTVR